MGNQRENSHLNFRLLINRNVDLRCFPLSYQNVHLGQIQPNKDTLCDSPTCRSPLERKIEELSKGFNKGLLDNQTETSDESSDNDDADVQLFAQASPDDSSMYFTSQEW